MDASDRDITLAWRMVALDRYKRLPKLETLLSTRPSERQTAAQQRSTLAMLSAQYGGTLRSGVKARKEHRG